MHTNRTERMKVNVFMTYDELSEYVMVLLDQDELVVEVLYYKGTSDEITELDLDKFEVVKSFTCTSLEEAELKYSEINDVRIAVPLVTGYFKNQNH